MNDSTRDVLDTLARVLLRCWIIGALLQVVTLGGAVLLSGLIHRIHAWLGLSAHESTLLVVGYATLIKLFVTLFFFIPWLAILLVLRKAGPRVSAQPGV